MVNFLSTAVLYTVHFTVHCTTSHSTYTNRLLLLSWLRKREEAKDGPGPSDCVNQVTVENVL